MLSYYYYYYCHSLVAMRFIPCENQCLPPLRRYRLGTINQKTHSTVFRLHLTVKCCIMNVIMRIRSSMYDKYYHCACTHYFFKVFLSWKYETLLRCVLKSTTKVSDKNINNYNIKVRHILIYINQMKSRITNVMI